MSFLSSKRIKIHPILEFPNKTKIKFQWNRIQLSGLKGETISSALIANGINIFGHHHKDKSPQGLFCANGQCSQCMVVANNIAVKSCMTKIESNMKISSIEGLPSYNKNLMNNPPKLNSIKRYNISVLIIGGGPAGLSAAIELGKQNIDTILIDDKDCLGGKLVLQTHKFFGSVEDSYAGTRGFKIGILLEKKLKNLNSVDIWLNSTAIGIFSDGVIGVLKDTTYKEIHPEKLLIATGAREKMISFPGNTLPGVYGAGAFQTLINRDLVKPSSRILIIGAGNVGLITAYHALQAGIEVVAIIEALSKIGGYKVHYDKIIRMGIPILTKHTIVSAIGTNQISEAIIAELDDNWKVKPKTYKKYSIDTILIATGLEKVDEFYIKAKQWEMDVYTAGDAQEIAEASAAMFTGKIEGLKIAININRNKNKIPSNWYKKVEILKSKPINCEKSILKQLESKDNKKSKGFYPIFHCHQKIPCNPCTSVCPVKAIKTIGNEITGLPYLIESNLCQGCMACVSICPGLAITLLDNRKSDEMPTLTLPCEMGKEVIKKDSIIPITDINGSVLGNYKVKRIITNNKKFPGTMLIQVLIEKKIATKASGIKFQNKNINYTNLPKDLKISNKSIICRCERIKVNKIRQIIRNGITNINQIKAMTRIGMGACGSKNCRSMILQLFKEEKIEFSKITDRVDRPLFIEVPIGILAGAEKGENNAR